MRIDSHQHFWNYNSSKHIWMNDKMNILKSNYLPNDIIPLLESCQLDGCVSVQANQAEEENDFLLENAKNFNIIKGIVGWVDLCSDTVEERLIHYKSFDKIKGFRHVLHDESQRDFMLRTDFMNGISKLNKYGFTYDILIFVDQLEYTLEFIKAFPNQLFVIDHIAKPLIKDNIISGWQEKIIEIASYPNVFCKISGLVTEADWKHWKKEDFIQYLDVVVKSFGFDRIMYGSDWPVCQLAANYKAQYEIVRDYFLQYSEENQNKFFGKNACIFYKL